MSTQPTDRATQEDLAWLVTLVANDPDGLPRHRRILNSLRAGEAVTQRAEWSDVATREINRPPTPAEVAALIRDFEDAVAECVRSENGSAAYTVSKWALEDALRQSEPQPTVDRERLARALYILQAVEWYKKAAARFWDTGGAAAEPTRSDWLGRADRLLDLLGGPLVVQAEPRAWECACGGVMPWRYKVCGECGEMVRGDSAATPLYAGAPAAPQAQTVAEVRSKLRRYGALRDSSLGGAAELEAELLALLFRAVPPEGAPTWDELAAAVARLAVTEYGDGSSICNECGASQRGDGLDHFPSCDLGALLSRIPTEEK